VVLAVISVEEALTKILNTVQVLDKETRPLLDCLGQVLAEDVYSSLDIPPHDNSAMDGYALQAKDIEGANLNNPRVLTVVGEVAAGDIPKVKVQSGTAVRIMTGAFVPDGADVVVPFEVTDEVDRKQGIVSKSKIGIRTSLGKGCNIRDKGEDIANGEMAFQKGKMLGPADIGVLASMGRNSISVTRRAVVGILATGNEVVDISQPLTDGKIYNSNSYSLAAQVLRYGGIPMLLGVAPDDTQQLTLAIRSGLDCDMLITSGGVSLGDYDIVKQVLAAEGKVDFWTVRMKPGKPLAFGLFQRSNGEQVPHLGLPGNPVSSMITFEVFARPAIFKMMGRNNSIKSNVTAVLEDSVRNSDQRRIFARVVVTKKNNEYFARLTGPQGSGILTSMAQANGLAIIPEDTTEVKSGERVEVMMLDWNYNHF
jgi:molybdopterin molybdotransferase